ncbi:MAG: hypothetical protein ACE5Z5_12155 [Candidatus Bathyarchaeia archaeon]
MEKLILSPELGYAVSPSEPESVPVEEKEAVENRVSEIRFSREVSEPERLTPKPAAFETDFELRLPLRHEKQDDVEPSEQSSSGSLRGRGLCELCGKRPGRLYRVQATGTLGGVLPSTLFRCERCIRDFTESFPDVKVEEVTDG